MSPHRRDLPPDPRSPLEVVVASGATAAPPLEAAATDAQWLSCGFSGPTRTGTLTADGVAVAQQTFMLDAS